MHDKKPYVFKKRNFKGFTAFSISWNDINGYPESNVFLTTNPHSRLHKLFNGGETFIRENNSYTVEEQRTLLKGRALNASLLLALAYCVFGGFTSDNVLLGSFLVVFSSFLIGTGFSIGKRKYGSWMKPEVINVDKFAVEKFENISHEKRIEMAHEIIAEELIKDDSTVIHFGKNDDLFTPEDAEKSGKYAHWMKSLWMNYEALNTRRAPARLLKSAEEAISSALVYNSAQSKWNRLRSEGEANDIVFEQMKKYSESMIQSEQKIKTATIAINEYAERNSEEN